MTILGLSKINNDIRRVRGWIKEAESEISNLNDSEYKERLQDHINHLKVSEEIMTNSRIVIYSSLIAIIANISTMIFQLK